MSRVYVPWTDRGGPEFRGPAKLIARLGIAVYRIFGPIVRRFPGLILITSAVVACLLAWGFTVAFADIESVNRHLGDAGVQPAGVDLVPWIWHIHNAWSVEQVGQGAEAAGARTPAYVLWAIQSLLVRDIIALHGVIIFVSLVAVIGIWGERKVAGRIQSRPGPMRTGGWHGWSQSVADGIKLIGKEDIIPKDADAALFRLAPYISFVPALCAFLVLPFGTYWVFRDLDVGLLFILAMLGLEILGVILAGWASNNKWSLFGGMREACQVVSYEIPMGMSLLIPVMVAGSLRFSDIAEMQSGGWFTWLAFHSPWSFVALFTYYIASLASCKRAPFDLPEGESELVSGFHTEYSGFRWSLFFFAEYAAMFAVSGIAAILFLGAWHAPWPAPEWLVESREPAHQLLYGVFFSGPLIFVIKCALLVYLQMWLRWTLPRIRIDQVLYSCVQVMLPLVMVVLLASTFWELGLERLGTGFNLLAAAVRFVLGALGLAAALAIVFIVWHGVRNRRSLVGTLAVDLRPGA